MTPGDHAVQIYRENDEFLDALEEYVVSGLRAGDAIIIIATDENRRGLENRLRQRDLPGGEVDLDKMRLSNQYIEVRAEDMLSSIMVDDWPNDARFHESVMQLLTRARGGQSRRVRAFGEMVALLWSQGKPGATIWLEQLWHKMCRQEKLNLFCAYPELCLHEQTEPGTSATDSINMICAAHSRVLTTKR